MHALTQAAFKPYEDLLDPPSGVTRETVEAVRQELAEQGGALACSGAEPVGCLRFEARAGHLHVRRVAVAPAQQGRGVGRALMAWAHAHARSLGLGEVRLGVRRQLPGNRAFYEHLGYEVVGEHSHPGHAEVTWYEMRLLLPPSSGGK